MDSSTQACEDKWYACRQQILGDTKLIVGCPMISSAGNMKFWLYLCQASSSQGSEEAVASFLQAAAKGKESLAAYSQQYNADLVHKVSRLLILGCFWVQRLMYDT